jgi:hypothetical protein
MAEPTEPLDPHDNTFFSKRALQIGTAVRYHGVTDPGSLWFVTRIYTTLNGAVKPRKESFPQTLKDTVQLTNHVSGDVRHLRFGTLSYSAIWRIEE